MLANIIDNPNRSMKYLNNIKPKINIKIKYRKYIYYTTC